MILIVMTPHRERRTTLLDPCRALTTIGCDQPLHVTDAIAFCNDTRLRSMRGVSFPIVRDRSAMLACTPRTFLPLTTALFLLFLAKMTDNFTQSGRLEPPHLAAVTQAAPYNRS